MLHFWFLFTVGQHVLWRAVLSPRSLIRVYVNTASRPDRKHATGDELGRAPIAFSFSFFFSFSFSVFVSVSALSLSLFPFPFLFLFSFSSLFYGSRVSTVYNSSVLRLNKL